MTHVILSATAKIVFQNIHMILSSFNCYKTKNISSRNQIYMQKGLFCFKGNFIVSLRK